MRKQWIRWLPFVVVAVQVALYATGVLSLAEAAILLLVLEGLLAVVVVGEFLMLARAYRTSQRAGAGRAQAFGDALDAVLPRPLALLVRQEFRIFAAASGALRRRRAVAPGDRVITYGGRMTALLIVMVFVSVVELAAVELLVPWGWLRWTLLVLGAYGLLWVIGFGSSAYTRPHSVGPTDLRLRLTIFADVAVPTGAVGSVGGALGSHNRSVEVGDGTLAVSVLGLTNVVVRLTEPVEVDLGRAGRRSVHTVRFFADDPVEAAAIIRVFAPVETTGQG